MADIIGVEIFDEGTWVGLYGVTKWTSEDIDEVIQNTQVLMDQGQLNPKLKFGHSSEQFWDEAQVLEGQSDGDPSIGEASNFRKSGTKIICDFVNVPDIVYSAISAGLYTSVSAELQYIQNFGWFVSAIALLGVDPPAVKTLEDLRAFLSEASNNAVTEQHLKFSAPKIYGGSMLEQVTKTDSDISKVLDTLMQENRDLKAKFSEVENKFKSLQTELEDKDKVLSEYEKKVIDQQFTDQFHKITFPYREDVKKGLLKPDMFSKIETCLNSQKADFKANSTLALTPELAREVALSYSEKLQTEEQGKQLKHEQTDNSPDEVLAVEIAKIQSNNSALSYTEAADYVAKINPGVWKNYITWTEKISETGKHKEV